MPLCVTAKPRLRLPEALFPGARLAPGTHLAVAGIGTRAALVFPSGAQLSASAGAPSGDQALLRAGVKVPALRAAARALGVSEILSAAPP